MFKAFLINSLAIAGLAMSAATCCAAEPENLDLLKKQLIQYHDSQQYQKDMKAVIDQAIQYTETRIKDESPSKKLAIVLDIDETALSNYNDMRTLNFGGSFKEIVQDEGMGHDPVIDPTLQLYRYAKAHNIAVFFVTGRTERFRAATVKNLTQAGYRNWDGLILKPENYHEKSAAPYKIASRENITKKGYDIVENIGDQESDLAGGYADKTFKLPNPYYTIP